MRETHKDPQLEQGNHLDREAHEFVQELTALALTGLPAITSPCFVLTRELEEWTKIEDHVTGRSSRHALKISLRLVGSVATSDFLTQCFGSRV